LNGIKPPQALTDIYRDLRDRRLLLPALALLIAIVAVPVLLKTSETQPPPAVAPVTGGKASPVSSAVLADTTVSVRNYRKRLDQLKSTNPFRPQFEAASSGDGASTGGTGSTDTASTATTATGSTDTSASVDVSTPSGSVDVTTDNTSTTVDETTNGGTGGGNGQTQPSSSDVEVVNHLFTRRVDLMIGLQGDPKLRENVKPMTILPDPATPVVAFLGTDEKGDRAAFVVSKEATMVAGDGACVPTPEQCLYITLEKNETATLDFGPNGQTFDLRLLEIRDHQLPAE
jgi:hypothetical protein